MHILPLLRPVSLVALVASTVALTGCVYDTDPPRRLAPDPPHGPPPPAREAGGGGTSGRAPEPMLVEVDPDQTMDAAPGEGVGVFVEYGTGGHWSVWWTCDTNLTRQRCDFNVSVTAASVSNVDSSGIGDDGRAITDATSLRVLTTTRDEVHGVRFDTEPGAVITLEATVGALKDGAFLFFVQDGQVNGGFSGTLSNPLRLQGKSP